MTDRIDDFLDGRLNRDAMSSAEQAEADVIGRAAADVRTFLASRPAPDVTASVLRRIDAAGAAGRPASGRLTALIRRIWHPVQVSVRPAYVLAGAAAILLLFAYARGGVTGPSGPPAGAPPLFVQFRLEADASRVELAGSFTNWERRHELRQTAPGHWSVTLPLAEGVHDYAFLVDGQRWVADPYAAQVRDGFGGINNRLTLLLPAEPSPRS